MGRARWWLILAAVTLVASACSPLGSAPITLNIATAGDTNMAELQTDVFGPEFTRKNPNTKINVISTGPADAGSAAVYTRLKAQKDAGKKAWDIDLAVVHQSIMGQLMQDDLLEKYVPSSSVAKHVTAANAKNSLGTDVDGYVVPMFQAQVAIAYNPKYAKAPQTLADVIAFIKANPKRFGYNGIEGGMSGVGFATAYLYWRSGQYGQMISGPYDKGIEAGWADIYKELKALNSLCTITAGNNGTLDLLNREEIWMGPVWVDMLVLWKSEGRIDSSIAVALPEPGLPGQPMYLVIPKQAAHKAQALKFIEMVASPQQQAGVIVERNGWYPGIDAGAVIPLVSQTTREKIFRGVSAEDLASKGLVFPIAPYFRDLQAVYAQAMQ